MKTYFIEFNRLNKPPNGQICRWFRFDVITFMTVINASVHLYVRRERRVCAVYGTHCFLQMWICTLTHALRNWLECVVFVGFWVMQMLMVKIKIKMLDDLIRLPCSLVLRSQSALPFVSNTASFRIVQKCAKACTCSMCDFATQQELTPKWN